MESSHRLLFLSTLKWSVGRGIREPQAGTGETSLNWICEGKRARERESSDSRDHWTEQYV